VGLQGVVSPARLQAHSTSALVYVADAMGGSGWAKVMALSLVLSVIASTGTGIVLISRIVYGMASRRVLPAIFGTVNRRFATPAIATLTVGLVVLAVPGCTCSLLPWRTYSTA
jgi:amino acid transporter